MNCPSCNSSKVKANGRLHVCSKCGALFGQCYKGDAYNHVKFNTLVDGDLSQAKYFDLTLLGSTGLQRVHGWYNPATKEVLQQG